MYFKWILRLFTVSVNERSRQITALRLQLNYISIMVTQQNENHCQRRLAPFFNFIHYGCYSVTTDECYCRDLYHCECDSEADVLRKYICSCCSSLQCHWQIIYSPFWTITCKTLRNNSKCRSRCSFISALPPGWYHIVVVDLFNSEIFLGVLHRQGCLPRKIGWGVVMLLLLLSLSHIVLFVSHIEAFKLAIWIMVLVRR